MALAVIVILAALPGFTSRVRLPLAHGCSPVGRRRARERPPTSGRSGRPDRSPPRSNRMGLGLIDEYRIFVSPVVFGGGRPMFKDINDKITLKV
jgi:hypothetical protein